MDQPLTKWTRSICNLFRMTYLWPKLVQVKLKPNPLDPFSMTIIERGLHNNLIL